MKIIFLFISYNCDLFKVIPIRYYSTLVYHYNSTKQIDLIFSIDILSITICAVFDLYNFMLLYIQTIYP